MSQIFIDKKSLQSDASKVLKQIQELQRTEQKLEKLVIEISAKWEGEACKVFISKLQSQIKKSKNLIKALTAYYNYINSVISKFEELEKRINQLLRNAF